MDYYIPQPPKEIFEHTDTISDGILKENPVTYVIEKILINSDKGILVYYKDVPFPRKGFPTPESVGAANVVKRVFIESIKTFSKKQFIISWFLLFFSKGSIEKLLLSFNRISYGVMSHYILKPEYMSPLASEFQGIIYMSLVKFGISKGTSRQFAKIFGSLIDYDNAYRYRLEDLFTETSRELMMEDPRREFKKILKIFLERERMWTVSNKFKNIYKLIALPLMFSSVRYSLKEALRHCEFERLQFDDIDRYWCSMRTDYNYFGKPYGERMIDFKMPMGVNIKV